MATLSFYVDMKAEGRSVKYWGSVFVNDLSSGLNPRNTSLPVYIHYKLSRGPERGAIFARSVCTIYAVFKYLALRRCYEWLSFILFYEFSVIFHDSTQRPYRGMKAQLLQFRLISVMAERIIAALHFITHVLCAKYSNSSSMCYQIRGTIHLWWEICNVVWGKRTKLFF